MKLDSGQIPEMKIMTHAELMKHPDKRRLISRLRRTKARPGQEYLFFDSCGYARAEGDNNPWYQIAYTLHVYRCGDDVIITVVDPFTGKELRFKMGENPDISVMGVSTFLLQYVMPCHDRDREVTYPSIRAYTDFKYDATFYQSKW